ncbi:hypothetical protein DB31_2549 [Hyalangium minutum]|uniref:Uncharacterized protein n=1 Tax=Hyalangium minutum TaxID=394096 RepID=A0A085W6W8_9BACT|nr:hypothetical protein DB31_2549 [Hyalangium minutum]
MGPVPVFPTRRGLSPGIPGFGSERRARGNGREEWGRACCFALGKDLLTGGLPRAGKATMP